jgi:hypothetical protein
MALTAKNKGEGFEPVPAGTYPAVCYGVYDLGTHTNRQYGVDQRKVLIQFEIPELRIEIEKDGKKQDLPRAISKRYTLSLNEKSHLRPDLESWRGKAFTEEELDGWDVFRVLGVSCMLNVLHVQKDNKTYANIHAIVPYRGPKLQPENPLQKFSFEETPIRLPKQCPEWVQKIIQQSHEWNLPSGSVEHPDDERPDDLPEEEIPF